MSLLDTEALDLFAQKGKEAGPGVPQTGHGNAVKVRRVLQIVEDLCSRPLDELRVLDLACGEGVYAIETALHGAEVVAVDGRTERMDGGATIAERHGLTNLRFEQADVRSVTRGTHGEFDAIYLLGILYHLDVADVVAVLCNAHEMCRELVVIDTHYSLAGDEEVRHDGRVYRGARVREHADGDSQAARRARLQPSLDNTFSFRFTKDSLNRLLVDCGFTCVLECRVPLEPLKPHDRVTLVATRGRRVGISTYPWVNDKAEEEVLDTLRKLEPDLVAECFSARRGFMSRAKGLANSLLRPPGLEIRRL